MMFSFRVPWRLLLVANSRHSITRLCTQWGIGTGNSTAFPRNKKKTQERRVYKLTPDLSPPEEKTPQWAKALESIMDSKMQSLESILKSERQSLDSMYRPFYILKMDGSTYNFVFFLAPKPCTIPYYFLTTGQTHESRAPMNSRSKPLSAVIPLTIPHPPA
jgi:hypothetical protein